MLNKSLYKFYLIVLVGTLVSQTIYCGEFETKTGKEQILLEKLIEKSQRKAKRMDPETTVTNVFRSALKQGLHSAVSDTTKQVVLDSITWIPGGVLHLRQAILNILYKAAFGSYGFTSKDLVNINNRISYICTPFVSHSASALDLKRRTIGIEEEESEDPEIDQKWVDLRTEIITELAHGICYIKKGLPCYNILYIDAPKNGLKYRLAKIVHTFSAEDCEQITFYSLQAIKYIEMLINIFSKSKSKESASKKHEEIHRWLGLMNGAFEMVAQFLEGAKANKRFAFSKVNASGSSKANAIESLLGLGDKNIN